MWVKKKSPLVGISQLRSLVQGGGLAKSPIPYNGLHVSLKVFVNFPSALVTLVPE
jgi:hypothetical protein